MGQRPAAEPPKAKDDKLALSHFAVRADELPLDPVGQRYDRRFGKVAISLRDHDGIAMRGEQLHAECEPTLPDHPADSVEREKVWAAVRELENVQGATSTITYKGTDGVPLRQVALVKVVKGNRELVLQEAPDPALVPAPKL